MSDLVVVVHYFDVLFHLFDCWVRQYVHHDVLIRVHRCLQWALHRAEPANQPIGLELFDYFLPSLIDFNTILPLRSAAAEQVDPVEYCVLDIVPEQEISFFALVSALVQTEWRLSHKQLIFVLVVALQEESKEPNYYWEKASSIWKQLVKLAYLSTDHQFLLI
jgi:hypothetical protein